MVVEKADKKRPRQLERAKPQQGVRAAEKHRLERGPAVLVHPNFYLTAQAQVAIEKPVARGGLDAHFGISPLQRVGLDVLLVEKVRRSDPFGSEERPSEEHPPFGAIGRVVPRMPLQIERRVTPNLPVRACDRVAHLDLVSFLIQRLTRLDLKVLVDVDLDVIRQPNLDLGLKEMLRTGSIAVLPRAPPLFHLEAPRIQSPKAGAGEEPLLGWFGGWPIRFDDGLIRRFFSWADAVTTGFLSRDIGGSEEQSKSDDQPKLTGTRSVQKS